MVIFYWIYIIEPAWIFSGRDGILAIDEALDWIWISFPGSSPQICQIFTLIPSY